MSEQRLVRPRKNVACDFSLLYGNSSCLSFPDQKSRNNSVHLSHPPTYTLEDGRVNSLRLRGPEWGKVLHKWSIVVL